MIEEVHIQNFKSIYDLKIKTGRINLFIGENGSGKSNLLEALVFVSASDSNKLDNEFLVSRGIRVTHPTLMCSAFSEEDKNRDIKIGIVLNNERRAFLFNHTKFLLNNTNHSQWKSKNFKSDEYINDLLNNLSDYLSEDSKQKSEEINDKIQDIMLKLDKKPSYKVENFITYSPENTALRNFYKEGQIEPLGINGEGLLRLLKAINNYEDNSYINTIIESLQLFSWFEDIKIPTDISSGEDKVVIKDKYLYKEIDQRSANEGFLFILFYITLIVAKETPKAFAIDNIDASLNPKLCTKLMLIIAKLAKKYDKQIFLTTHNPAILDGIDLNDEEQKLFVVSRNKLGHTRMKQITADNKPKSSDDEPLLLSEAFLRGYLGGLPKGF